ncbi:hypothetical protein [Bradyrhizobium glycinis]|uniref:hypothetical protein n=1 Tax=Bradyrhizobium glycinis TaxID=2751812 RepID=UPI0018D5C4B8|nr:hypothetical protein [Bradyrhizobium glycinis]MBH5371579.1 hypothetical protein [Bradyrhizobium glycinis]
MHVAIIAETKIAISIRSMQNIEEEFAPMWLNTPRITPVDDAAITAAQAEALEPFYWTTRANILLTLAKNPEALTCLTPWLKYFSWPKNHDRGRAREIAVLRTAFLCKSGYKWVWHAILAGVTEEVLPRVKEGAGWLERRGGSVDPSCRRASPGFRHR